MGSRKSRKHRAARHKLRKNRKLILAVSFLVIVAIVIGGYYVFTQASSNNINTGSNEAARVLLQTTMGNITIQLRNDMPITVGNFRNLVQQGVYDGTIFHRVIANFMIQGGDPTGTGYGDPSIPTIEDEFSSNSTHNRVERGTIAMANTGAPDSGSSQF